MTEKPLPVTLTGVLHRPEETEREAYVRRSVDRLFREWLIKGPFLGAAIFLLLGVLDYVAAREYFSLFLTYRFFIAAFLLFTAWCGTKMRRRASMQLCAYTTVFFSALAIEAMILKFGGHGSTYYPGMILLGVAIFGIFPAEITFHLLSAGIIYLTYLLPLLIFDDITSVPFFFTANTFIVGTFATAILLRHYQYRTLLVQFGLQFDLERHHSELEAVVEERTSELSGAVAELHAENRERRHTEEKLVEALVDWRTTFDSAREVILMLDGDMRIRKLNRAAAEYLNCPYEGSTGRDFYELLGECSLTRSDYPLEKMRRSLSHQEAEIFLPERGGWFIGSADPILDEEGRLAGAVHMLHEINEIKEMQDEITSAKAEWEETFDVINDAITIHDKRFRIVRANRAAEALLGSSMESILSRPCFELYHGTFSPPSACPSCDVLHSGRPCTSEIFEPHLGKYLEIKALPTLDDQGGVAGLVHIVRDITARKEAEEHQLQLQSQLQHAQKMESIGRLAGGVAHDFNNILFAMLGYTELAISKLPKDHLLQKHLHVIQESGERAASLNHQLLAFSRKQVLDFQPVSLGTTIENMLKMLERLIGENYALRVEAKGQARSVMADAGQIEQILMNLVVNARDALSDGGEIAVNADDIDLPKELQGSHGTVPAGSYVVLEVSDSGTGMSREVQEHIFEPFYTTKKTGEGSGLGLSTVYGIVQQHEGFISVFSRPGEGTIFRVYLPTGKEPKAAAAEKKAENPGGGSETILVVEDEPHVRQLVRDVLEPLGYNLLEAQNGREALDLLEGDAPAIHLLLSDVVMPGMNGWEFSKAFRRLYPDAKVIFMSGYTDDIINRHGVSASEEALIQKPVRPVILARIIREVLDGVCRLNS